MVGKTLFTLCAVLIAGVLAGDIMDNTIYDHAQTKVVSSHIRSMKAIKNYISEEIVDFVVEDIKERIDSFNESNIEIGDMRVSFEQKWLGITMEGVLFAENGRLSKPRSIRRIEHPSIEHKEKSMIVTFSISMSEVEMTFDTYTASMLTFNDTGAFKLIVPQTNVSMEVVVEYVPECNVRIGKVMTTIGEPEFYVRGLEVFKFLEEAISILVAEQYQRQIDDAARSLAMQRIREIPVRTIICQHHKTLIEYSSKEFRLLGY